MFWLPKQTMKLREAWFCRAVSSVSKWCLPDKEAPRKWELDGDQPPTTDRPSFAETAHPASYG